MSQTISNNEYLHWTRTTAIYPDAVRRTLPAINYCALGLVGEAGEIANKLKKIYRDSKTVQDLEEKIEFLKEELGDVIWYVFRLADELGTTPWELMEKNYVKLESRKKRGKLGGSGDGR